MQTNTPFTEQLSETWLLERTYHAHLHNGRELPVADLTHAMKTLPNVYVPFSIWQEISQEEAHTTYQQGIPVLLYSEHPWKHPKKSPITWSASKNMHSLIFGSTWQQPEAATGTDYAVCYLDLKRGNASNDSWKMWFSSDPSSLLDGSASSTITFLGPRLQFPSTTHYTVIATDGHIFEYKSPFEAIKGFQTLPVKEVGKGSDFRIVFPQLCYYHEITCPDGVYHLEFFGPHMDEQGYRV
jgi:hypothetical protein